MSRLSIILSRIIFSVILLSGHSILAQESEGSGSKTHDGFFLNLQLGGGPGKVIVEKYIGSDLEFSGTAIYIGTQIGFTVVGNLNIFGLFNEYTIFDPDVTWLGSAGGTINTEMTVSEFGVGINYYIMPVNIYFSGAITFPKSALKVNDASIDSEVGSGALISIGKEWWVSENWGLGISFFAHYGTMKFKDDILGQEFDETSSFYGVAFTATYN